MASHHFFEGALIQKALAGALNEALTEAIEKQVREQAEPIIQAAIEETKKQFKVVVQTYLRPDRDERTVEVKFR